VAAAALNPNQINQQNAKVPRNFIRQNHGGRESYRKPSGTKQGRIKPGGCTTLSSTLSLISLGFVRFGQSEGQSAPGRMEPSITYFGDGRLTMFGDVRFSNTPHNGPLVSWHGTAEPERAYSVRGCVEPKNRKPYSIN
jgi:hypothetical protein